MLLETTLRGLQEQAGAHFGDYFGCRLPERFTTTLEECRAARESVVVLDTNFRAFVWLMGPDRVRYLNAVTSNNIKDLAEGQGLPGLLLNPQGHILAEVECYALADRLLVLSHALVRPRTVETLDKYIIMDDVTLEDATEQFGALAVEGPKALGLVHEICGVKLEAMAEFSHCEAVIGPARCRVIRRSHFGETGAEFIVERQSLQALWQTLLEEAHRRSGAAAGYAALNALRLQAGIPWFGYDFDDRHIPHEAALETSHISYTKGCYTGQEIVERVRSRGHINRRRVSLQFSGPALPSSGAKLLAEGKDAGYVTSAAYFPLMARNIGMGYLRREYNSPGSQVQWGGGTAEVIELPVLKVSPSASAR